MNCYVERHSRLRDVKLISEMLVILLLHPENMDFF